MGGHKKSKKKKTLLLTALFAAAATAAASLNPISLAFAAAATMAAKRIARVPRLSDLFASTHELTRRPLVPPPGITPVTSPPPGTSAVSVLVHNIQHIPQLFSQKYPREKLSSLKNIFNEHSLVLAQEVFSRPQAMGKMAGSRWHWAPEFNRNAVMRFFVDISNKPGLLTISERDLKRENAVAFDHCHGYFMSGGDWWVRKGIQISRMGKVAVCNTHLDAGDADGDRAARRHQLDTIAASLPEGPVILGGDFNCKALDEGMLQDFMRKTGLKLVVRNGLDCLFVRGPGITCGESHLIDSAHVSDHDALSVTLHIANDLLEDPPAPGRNLSGPNLAA